MGGMSRRDFFFCGRVAESAEVMVGRLSDFPPGTYVARATSGIVIEALAEGLRAQSVANGSIFYAIKLNSIGELVVNRAETWPSGQVFSVLTSEPTWLDPSGEDRS